MFWAFKDYGDFFYICPVIQKELNAYLKTDIRHAIWKFKGKSLIEQDILTILVITINPINLFFIHNKWRKKKRELEP